MLPKETEEIWKFLKNEPALAGFILIGGSALSHRPSRKCAACRRRREEAQSFCPKRSGLAYGLNVSKRPSGSL
jgi:hypothetical protein